MDQPFNLAGLAAFAKTPLTGELEVSPSRKNSLEGGMAPPTTSTSTLSSTTLPDLSAQLAGLGLTSVAAFDLSPPVPSSSQRNSRRTSASGRRNSRRTSEPRKKGGEGGGGGGARVWPPIEDDVRSSLGPASSRMTAQTSQTSSISPTTNAGATPSTNQSDAFEFSSLVASRTFCFSPSPPFPSTD
jgi:hypothetical protein